MAAKRSAGIMLYRRRGPSVEVLLGHMGGPFWTKRDIGGWSIPKGGYEADEAPEAAARREFHEELGLPAPAGQLVDLGEVRQSSGKVVAIWALESDLDTAKVVPGMFDLEWPSGSGRIQQFPELDRAAWLDVDAARAKIVAGQVAFLDRLLEHLRG
jgi:predicted NUDIX family NTP pyrophosphohydrolase